jgi:hypothetical protein
MNTINLSDSAKMPHNKDAISSFDIGDFRDSLESRYRHATDNRYIPPWMLSSIALAMLK